MRRQLTVIAGCTLALEVGAPSASAATAAYSAAPVAQCCSMTLETGDTAEQYMDFRNTGTARWLRDGQFTTTPKEPQIILATGSETAEPNRISPCYNDADWLGKSFPYTPRTAGFPPPESRPTALDQAEVARGGVGRCHLGHRGSALARDLPRDVLRGSRVRGLDERSAVLLHRLPGGRGRATRRGQPVPTGGDQPRRATGGQLGGHRQPRRGERDVHAGRAVVDGEDPGRRHEHLPCHLRDRRPAAELDPDRDRRRGGSRRPHRHGGEVLPGRGAPAEQKTVPRFQVRFLGDPKRRHRIRGVVVSGVPKHATARVLCSAFCGKLNRKGHVAQHRLQFRSLRVSRHTVIEVSVVAGGYTRGRYICAGFRLRKSGAVVPTTRSRGSFAASDPPGSPHCKGR